MAAVSLTIQLVDTVNTVREFWMKMKNAQAEVGEIVDDLMLLNCILDGVLRAYVRCVILLISFPSSSL
jgi:dynactin complex subunit